MFFTVIFLFITYKLFFKSQPSKKHVEDWRRWILSNQHWEIIPPLLKKLNYTESFTLPVSKSDYSRLEPEPYQWSILASVINFIERYLFFIPHSAPLSIIDKIKSLPVVQALGGKEALELIHWRLHSWIEAVEWNELSGIGKLALTDRIQQFYTELVNFTTWYSLHHTEIVSPDGKDNIKLQPIIFILGAPRTGTTLLHHLISLDPKIRAPRLFEMVHVTSSSFPFPRTSSQQLDNDERLPRTKQRIDLGGTLFGQDFYNRIAASHPTIKIPNMPDEDTVFTFYLGSCVMYEYLTVGKIDLWKDYSSSIDSDTQWSRWADVHCLWLKRFYQMLQLGYSPERWTGKSPYHSVFVPWLVKHFGPEVYFIVPKRSQSEIVPSLARMVQSLVVGLHCKQDSIINDLRVLGKWASRDSWCLGNVNVHSSSSTPNLIEVDYKNLISDPVETLREVYDKAGFGKLEQEHVEKIQEYLQENSQGKHGRNKYSMQHYGLDEEDLMK